MSSLWGHKIKISLFGESHGPAIGVVIDGLPPGFAIDIDDINRHMARRAPGLHPWSTSRKENDQVEILSGLYGGKTTGTPLCAIIRNKDARSGDYQACTDRPRPGHADLTGLARYEGANDPRGGGHFSGRLMAPLCFAGATCAQILSSRGIKIYAHIAEIAGICDTPYDVLAAPKQVADKPFAVLDDAKGDDMKEAIFQAQADHDSVGGMIEAMATGFPAGLGRPIFFGIESRVAAVLFSIPAVKAVEFGRGADVARARGSENNDVPQYVGHKIRHKTNHAGGIEGGISNGMPIVCRLALKPTPSIAKTQDTIDLSQKTNTTLTLEGRHDPCIVPRAVPVVESAMAFALLDILEDG